MEGQISGSPKPANAAVARQSKNKKHGKAQQSPSPAQVDAGAVSDSVVTNNSPRTQKTKKQQQAQSNGQHKTRHQPHNSSSGIATPLKEQAYAGPTFQNSPAASSLPIPKLFARQAAQKPVSDKSSESSPEIENASPIPNRSSVKSPLDVFFNADREEKRRHSSVQSGKSNLLQEMDGEQSPVSSHAGARKESNDQHLKDTTQALKQLLFSPNGTPAPQPPSHHQTASPSPLQHYHSNPATPVAVTEQQQNYFYGNKQLSPMFQASRGTPPPKTAPQQLPQQPMQNQASPARFSPAPYQQYQPYQPYQQYQQHQHQAHLANGAFPPVHSSQQPNITQHPPGFSPAYSAQTDGSRDHQVHQGVGQSPRNPVGGNDVQNMEDNLRRILKLGATS